MKSYTLHLSVVMFAAITVAAGGVFLAPGEGRIAAIALRTGDYSSALQLYEQKLQSGGWVRRVVVPLSQVYLQYGDIDKSIQILEQYLEKRPNDYEARRVLNKNYLYAQRTWDYMDSLENMIRQKPEAESLEELAKTYNFSGMLDKQADTLQRLATLKPSDTDNLLNLAQIEVTLRRYENAAIALRKLKKANVHALTAYVINLFVQVLGATGKTDEAFTEAEEWLASHKDPKTALLLATQLQYQHRNELALRLLGPYESELRNIPDALDQYAWLLMANNRSDEALALLSDLDEKGGLDGDTAAVLIDLLISHNGFNRAVAIADKLGVRKLREPQIVSLIEAALQLKRTDVASRYLNLLGEAFKRRNPVVAAREALVRKAIPEAEYWVAQAEQSTALNIFQRLDLVDLYTLLVRQDDARRVLRGVAEERTIPEGTLVFMAGKYAELGMVDEGLAFFKRIRAAGSSPQVDRAWSIIAIRAGLTDDVVKIVDSLDDKEAEPQWLQDLYVAAQDRGIWPVMLATGERTLARSPSPEAAAMLIRGLLAAGDRLPAVKDVEQLLFPTDGLDAINVRARQLANIGALRLSRAFARMNPDYQDKTSSPLPGGCKATVVDDAARANLCRIEEMAAQSRNPAPSLRPVRASLESSSTARAGYVAALALAVDAREPLGVSLTRKMRQYLVDPAMPEDQRYVAATTLIRLRDYQGVLPYLRDRYNEEPDRWGGLYFDTLYEAGSYDELTALADGQVVNGLQLKPEERRIIAFRLLEKGQRKPAEKIFMALADKEGPNGEDVRQLLYLWGPRPNDNALAWIKNRTQNAAAQDRAAWLRVLMDAGQYTLVMNLAEDMGVNTPGVGQVYVEAAQASNERQRLVNYLRRTVGSETSEKDMLDNAQLAEQEGLYDLAQKGLQRAYDRMPENDDVAARLGKAAYINRDYRTAHMALAKALNSSRSDYLTNLYYGDLLSRDGRNDDAALYYRQALDILESKPSRDYETRKIHASLLARTNRISEARQEFDDLLRDHPNDANLKAEYASAMLWAGQLAKAGKLLKALP